MHWKFEFTETADKQLQSLDKSDRERIKKYAYSLEALQNTRIRGEALTGDLFEFRKYRVGKYRLICRLEDNRILILVVKIGKRDKVYK